MKTTYTFVYGDHVTFSVQADSEVEALAQADEHVREVTGEESFSWYDTDQPHVYVLAEDVYLGV